MASTEHKNKRRALAIERLNLAALRLAHSKDMKALEIPKKTRDKDMREIVVFERIAEFLEALVTKDAPTLEDNPLVIKQANRVISKAKRPKTEAIREVK